MKQPPQISRIHRVLGQIRGIEKMITHKRPCPEIIQQLLAVRSSIEGICAIILQQETSKCFAGNNKECQKKLKDLKSLTSNLFKLK